MGVKELMTCLLVHFLVIHVLYAASPTWLQTDFCQLNATHLPDTSSWHKPMCGGRCGDLALLPTSPCSCDNMCQVYGDCCYDQTSSCQDHSLPNLRSHNLTTSCEPYKVNQTSTLNYRVVSTCQGSGAQCVRTHNLTQVNGYIPLYEPSTGLLYINAECALCNNVTSVIFWQPHLQCTTPDPKNTNTSSVSTEKDLITLLEINTCEVYFTIPHESFQRECHPHMISFCPSNCDNAELVNMCHTFSQAIVETNQGIYKNVYCALCHGTQEYINLLDDQQETTLESTTVTIMGPPTTSGGTGSPVLPPGTHGDGTIVVDPSEGLIPGRSPPPDGTPCRHQRGPPGSISVDPSCDPDIEGPPGDRVPPEERQTPSPVQTSSLPQPTPGPAVTQRPSVILSDFSLSLLVDFDPRRGLFVGLRHSSPTTQNTRSSPTKCEPGLSAKGGKCIKKNCPPNMILKKDKCVPSSVSTVFSITMNTTSKTATDTLLVALENNTLGYTLKEEVETHVQNISIKIHINNTDIFNGSNDIFVTIAISHSSLTGFDGKSNHTILSSNFSDFVISKLDNFMEEFSKSYDKELISYEISVNSDSILFKTVEPSSTKCSWVTYEDDAFSIQNKTIVLVEDGRIFHKYRMQPDGSVLICDEAYNETDVYFYPYNIKDRSIEGILTIVCGGLSVICLLIRICLQPFVPMFRKFPGIMQFSLVVALFLAFVSWLVSPLAFNLYMLCQILAVIKHWSFLCSFLWMNCIAFDAWNTFRHGAALRKPTHLKKQLLVYSLFSWGVPLLPVGLAIGLQHVPVDIRFHSGFFLGGFNKCWFSQRYALLAFFGVPLLLSVLISCVLYIKTACILYEAFKSHTNTTTNQVTRKKSVIVYLRLFILMGITWIIALVSAFVQSDVMIYIFIILISSQGVFIFIAFVCTKKVCVPLCRREKKKCYSNSHPDASRKASTTSSLLTLNVSSNSTIPKQPKRLVA